MPVEVSEEEVVKGCDQMSQWISIPIIEEPPRKNWKKAAGILTACFLMVLCIAGIIYIVYNTPERRVMRGFGHLAEEIEELRSESNGLQGESEGLQGERDGLQGENSSPQGNGVQVSTKFNVSGEGLPNTIGVDTVLLIALEEQSVQDDDVPKDNVREKNVQKEDTREEDIREEDTYDGYRVSADTKFSVMNNELATVSFYIDEQEDLIQAALPDFWDGHLELAQDNLDRQYNKSVLADYWGMVPENGISLHLLTKRLVPQQFLEGMTVEEIGDVIVEEKYKCKQYRVWFPEPGITAEIALDRKNYIREIVLSEPWKIAEAESDMGTSVLPELICVESARFMLSGERHSIDDIGVSIDMRIESEKWNWLTVASSEKGLLQADLRLEGKVTCGGKGRNDAAVSFELSKLTISVDGLGEYLVTGTASADGLAKQPRSLSGEAVTITEFPEETYLEIQENIRKEIEKWQKTYSATQGTKQSEPKYSERQQSESQQSKTSNLPVFLDNYNVIFSAEDAKRAALIYLDEDPVPELLILKNGEYKLYTLDDSEVKEISMPNAAIHASAYGPQYDFQESEYQTFYWFEYVPYKGLMRVHSGIDGARHDYYLQYTNGQVFTALETESNHYAWYTYDAEKEIANEEFSACLSDLGYDQLIPCGYLYDNLAAAYENIAASSDTQKTLDDFVNGKTGALDYVEEIKDIPEDGFVMKSYEDYYDYITAGEGDIWGAEEYIDFDNDGKDELIIHGYAGACLFFDVIGDTVYKVLETGSASDIASVAEIDGRRVIERTDLLHAGRKYYRIMEFDFCCSLIDWLSLYASYEGESYSEEDEFMYRDREISMEEFEEIRDSIQAYGKTVGPV